MRTAPAKQASCTTTGCAVLFVVGLIVAISNGVSSDEKPNSAPAVDYPSSGPGHLVSASIIWRSKAAFEEGIRLGVNGSLKAHPELALPLAACATSGGDAVTIIDRSFTAREVILDSGKSKGCRGWVEMEAVGR